MGKDDCSLFSPWVGRAVPGLTESCHSSARNLWDAIGSYGTVLLWNPPTPMPFVRRAFVLLLLCGLSAGPAAAQPTAAPDSLSLSQIDGGTLQSTTLRYDVTVTAGGQSRTFSAVRALTATQTGGRDTWTVTDRTSLPQATVVDSLVLNRTTLRPVMRRLSGPMTMTVSYTDTSATGELQLRGRSQRIDASFDRPTLAGGANVRMALAALPLAPGVSATLPVYNEQQQSTQTLRFDVTGTESVASPAGTYDTFVVSIQSSGGGLSGTLHVRQTAPHHIVESTLTQPGPRGDRTFTRTLTSIGSNGPAD